MKKQFLVPALLLVGLATTLTSCKKDNDDAVNPSPQGCLVDRVTTPTAAGDSIQYSYDSENRVKKIQAFDKSGNSQGSTVYTYTSNKIVEANYDADNTVTDKVTYFLNSNNNVDYSVAVMKDASGEDDLNNADTTWYSYNGDKQNTMRATRNITTNILGITTSSYDTTRYTYSSGGNLNKVEESINGAEPTTTVYSYGSDDAKNELFTPESSEIRNLYGDSSKKLPISKSQNGSTLLYVYTFNSEGYPTRYEIKNGATTQETYNISYDCK